MSGSIGGSNNTGGVPQVNPEPSVKGSKVITNEPVHTDGGRTVKKHESSNHLKHSKQGSPFNEKKSVLGRNVQVSDTEGGDVSRKRSIPRHSELPSSKVRAIVDQINSKQAMAEIAEDDTPKKGEVGKLVRQFTSESEPVSDQAKKGTVSDRISKFEGEAAHSKKSVGELKQQLIQSNPSKKLVSNRKKSLESSGETIREKARKLQEPSSTGRRKLKASRSQPKILDRPRNNAEANNLSIPKAPPLPEELKASTINKSPIPEAPPLPEELQSPADNNSSIPKPPPLPKELPLPKQDGLSRATNNDSKADLLAQIRNRGGSGNASVTPRSNSDHKAEKSDFLSLQEVDAAIKMLVKEGLPGPTATALASHGVRSNKDADVEGKLDQMVLECYAAPLQDSAKSSALAQIKTAGTPLNEAFLGAVTKSLRSYLPKNLDSPTITTYEQFAAINKQAYFQNYDTQGLMDSFLSDQLGSDFAQMFEGNPDVNTIKNRYLAMCEDRGFTPLSPEGRASAYVANKEGLFGDVLKKSNLDPLLFSPQELEDPKVIREILTGKFKFDDPETQLIKRALVLLQDMMASGNPQAVELLREFSSLVPEGQVFQEGNVGKEDDKLADEGD
ncbi:hypothetical protein ACH42_04630 [Endozoicomonas sp. (ex Bugula neritina AB1)]|nr:hypothetical protein ACH42_04630 [Endozoicomonas sp. (ex Bugula neritina AB1)]